MSTGGNPAPGLPGGDRPVVSASPAGVAERVAKNYSWLAAIFTAFFGGVLAIGLTLPVTFGLPAALKRLAAVENSLSDMEERVKKVGDTEKLIKDLGNENVIATLKAIQSNPTAGTIVKDVLPKVKAITIDKDGTFVIDADVRLARTITVKDIESLSIASSLVPVGTVVPYIGDLTKIPRGWTLCDGQVLAANSADVAPEFWGKPVPDLRGRVFRGRTGDELVGSTGGSDKVASHTTKTAGAHQHSFE